MLLLLDWRGREGLGCLGVHGRGPEAGAGATTSIFTGAEGTASSASAVGVAAGVLGFDGAAVGEGLPRQWESPTPLPESPRVWQPGRDAKEVGTDQST